MNSVNKKAEPPRLARKILHWFLKKELAEEVEGDLEEQFYSHLEQGSLRRSRLDYWYQVVHYLRPFAIRNFSPLISSAAEVHASVLTPLIFIEHEPQIPSRHDLLKVNVLSITFLIRINISSTIGPQAFIST